jgi:hypothetical protein
MTDIRQGKVSASKFEQVVACEGQPQLERRLREQGLIGEEAPDEFALRGTRIHHALETGDISALSEDEVADFEKAKEMDAIAVGEWAMEKYPNSGQPVVTTHEQRLWLKDANDNQLCSGQYDRLSVCGNHAFVRDFKSGWSRRLTPSQQSWQLRLLAVLVWLEYGPKHGLETVRASFIKPKLRQGVDTVEYTIDDLLRSKAAIMQALWRSEQPDAARRAGDHCFYCPCKLSCVEAKSFSLLPSVVAGVSMGDLPTKAETKDKVASLQVHDLRYIWERSTVIRNILEAVNTRLKGLPTDDLTALGLTIGKGKRLDPITNTEGAFTVLEHTIPKSVWQCMKFSKTAIVDALVTERGMKKADAEVWVKVNLELFVDKKESEGALEELE